MPNLLNHHTIHAPAKINLHLSVKDRRTDGFHDLESIFLALDWGDELFFERSKNGDKVFLEWDDTIKPAHIQNNIVSRAIALFREKSAGSAKAVGAFDGGVTVHVKKRIPVGGGLGGGSSDAAAALLAMNKLTGSQFCRDELLAMGAALGSDVPFFLHETAAAWVTGRGENIEPIEAPVLPGLVLVNPGFSSDTAAAFRLLDEYRESKEFTARRHDPSIRCLGPDLWFKGNDLTFYNDFLPVFGEREKSVYYEIISDLKDSGAVFADLSGAGATCFGVFDTMEQTQRAAFALRAKWDFVQCCSIKSDS